MLRGEKGILVGLNGMMGAFRWWFGLLSEWVCDGAVLEYWL